MVRIFVLAGLLFPVASAWAWIPPARMILERTAENSGSGTYVIEQEVQIPNGAEPLVLRETWTIENEHTMKVAVTGTRELKDKLRFEVLYAGGQRWSIADSGRREAGVWPVDFAEKYFHWRHFETAAQETEALHVISANELQKKPLPRKAEDIRHDPEENVRLGRTAGVINWVFGSASSPGSVDKPPGLWIEQDQFVIRKIRLPSQAEITADDYSSYARGLQLPKLRTIQWGAQTVTIRLLSAASRPGTKLSTNSLAGAPARLEGMPEALKEFYKRFR